ncbi:MAG: signal peptidase I [Planctomycetaceae bacterium]|nr:signal peptidase I [Planctomycetaceae bacterium]
MSKKEPGAAAPAGAKKPPHHDGLRDTLESIVFAFLLALLFRTFEAEAFVIPTGSMAPTLYGRHKETVCKECRQPLVVGASTELTRESDDDRVDRLPAGLLARRVTSALCPNCGAENPSIHDGIPFNGDRILVNKFPYEFSEPDRWDVFVFKFPEDARVNYIKRLVGLPGETLRIRNGNVYRWDGQQEEILRKPPEKQRAIQLLVYDNSKVPQRIIESGWPERWAAVERLTDPEQGIGGWIETKTGWAFDASRRAFQINAASGQRHWIRYRHLLPHVDDWEAVDANLPARPYPRLITDFCGYNSYTVSMASPYGEPTNASSVETGVFWTPDLTLSCKIKIEQTQTDGELLLELCEGTRWYRCRVELASGLARLEEVNSQLNERVKQVASVETSLRGPGTYQLAFANVDDRLCLWINDALVEFGDGALIQSFGATENPLPTEVDLTPVGIAVQGATVTVDQLVLERDIYYRGTDGVADDYFHQELAKLQDDPDAWGQAYLKYSPTHDQLELVIPDDHFVALGDNSPASSDSRMWPGGHTVPRRNLVGKAFYVYWPHGVPFLNGGKGITFGHHRDTSRERKLTDYPKYSVPFYPQFSRMHRIR